MEETPQLQGNNFDLSSLRGGLDDTTPYMALEPDSCTTAENVEFYTSTLGERRRGCSAITIPSSMTAGTMDATTWMFRHLPTKDEGVAELWTLTQSLSGATNVLTRRDQTSWATISPTDAIDSTLTQGHKISAQTLHGKLFMAYKSAQNRLHVYDGSTLRRTGLVAVTGNGLVSLANTAVAGSYATLRYFRIRWSKQSGGVNVLRSEPSASASITPTGAFNGVTLTRIAPPGEGETHWEVEESLDDGNFYRIASVAIATSTYTDTLAATAIATTGILSDDIGDYVTLPSVKFLSADEDRLIMAGSWETPSEASRVRWTPVYAAAGIGNDERMESDTDPYLDLDGYEGGEITAMSRAINGYIYVFKRSHIYRLVRTGTRNKAYEAFPLTKTRGAVPGSLVESINQIGQPSIYFLDPSVGPCRLSAKGMQWCGRDIQTLWQRVNVNAKVPCHGVYYATKRQVHYWLAVDGADYPNIKIVLHVNEMRDTEEGARRGWVTVGLDNRIATAHCSVMFATNLESTAARSFALAPVIGKSSWVVGASTIRNYVQICDVGGTDADTTGDTLSAYRATIISKPFALAGLFNQHEVKYGVLLAKASATPDGSVYVRVISDFGKETKTVAVPLYSDSPSVTHVIQQLDNLSFAEIYTLQIALGDLDTDVTPPTIWELHRLQLKIASGQKA
jgi:hypothetical protein